MRSHSLARLSVLCLAVFLGFALCAPAHAQKSVTIDGDLTDLIAAIAAANTPDATTGFVLPDAVADVNTIQCAFTNGYDIENGYLCFDISDPGNVVLYAGWDQTGTVGDVDGNGNPDTITLNQGGCATADQAGIGVAESYFVAIDVDCNGIIDVFLGVQGNSVINVNTGAPIDGEYAVAGDKLELRIPNYQQYLPPGVGVCDASAYLQSNAQFDGLGEDFSDDPGILRVAPQIEVTKTPAEQDACAGEEVSFVITVNNPGTCTFEDVFIEDVLGAGLTYVSDDQGSSGDATTRTWTLEDFEAGDSFVINLVAQVAVECPTGQLVNDVSVQGDHYSDCHDVDPASATDDAQAFVNCFAPDVDIEKELSPIDISLGEGSQVTLTVTNTGSSVLDPVTVTDELSSGTVFDDTQVIGGTCGVTVVDYSSNVITFSDMVLDPGESCTIIYTIECGELGLEIPDVANVTAYCQGTDENPVTDEDDAFYNCACVPEVSLDKELSETSVTEGDGVTVTLTVTNIGDEPLDPVEVCDQLDAGTGFDDTQVVGGTCGVSVESYVDDKVTFSSFSLDPGESCTISYIVTCETAGTRVDLATVRAYCDGTDIYDEDSDEASYECSPPGDNCPRTPGFWSQQIGSPTGGSSKFTTEDMLSIIGCINDETEYFEFAGIADFIATVDDGGPHEIQAARQFAAFMANMCQGLQQNEAWNGEPVGLDASTPIDCEGFDAETLGELVGEVDDMMVAYAGMTSKASRHVFGSIIECLDGINNGVTVPLGACEAEEPEVDVASGFKTNIDLLGAIRPNPFNSSARISYRVPQDAGDANVTIKVYDVTGREVITLVNETMTSGEHSTSWDGRSTNGQQMTRGIYFMRIHVDGFAPENRRILYLP